MKKIGGRRATKITPELASILMKQEQLFVARFGREMGPDDRIFFNLTSPEDVNRQILEAMAKAEIAPELIYAFRKTGRILTKKARKNLTREEQKEWDDAINEYFEIQNKIH